jgi:hypothetical protein
MFPAWFSDCSQRERSPDTQVIDDTGRFGNDILPSYNDLYQLDNPAQSTSTARQYTTSGPATGYPLVGGLDFSAWENYDPEGDACFAAVSSASRDPEEMGQGVNDHDHDQEGRVSEERRSDKSGESDQLVDLDNHISPNRFPPTHRPDYPGHSSYLPLILSRPLRPSSPYEEKYDEISNGSMGSCKADLESSLDSNNGIGIGTSKRKYSDVEEEYLTNERASAGPSTQSAWKRGRFNPGEFDLLISSDDECDAPPTRRRLLYAGPPVPTTSMEVGEEWQGDSLTADTSDNGEMQSNSSRGEDVHQNTNNPDQQLIEAFISHQDLRIDHNHENSIQYDTSTEDHERYSDNTSQQLLQHSEGSDPDSTIEAVQWPSDTLTVVDPSADWLGHVPVHTSQDRQSSDDAMVGDQSGSDIQSPVHPADIQDSQLVSDSQMAVEPPSTLPPVETPDVSLRLNLEKDQPRR